MNKKGWLIYSVQDAEKNASFISWMTEEAAAAGLDLELRYTERFAFGVTKNQLSIYYEKRQDPLPAFAVVRTIHHLFSQQLEQLGVKVFNSSFVSRVANDKARTHQLLAEAGIPMMDTLFISPSLYRPDSLPFDFPLIAKLSSGRGGSQVHLVTDEQELREALSTYPHQEWVIQKPAAHPGRDVRVFVVGDQIVGAVLRSSDEDFRANFSLGGKAQFYDLNEEQKVLAQKVMSHFEMGMAGIDFLLDKDDSFIFNEVEDVVGSRTLSATSDINIVRTYMAHIAGQIKEPESD
ncbi:RimK family alpha-L-glutamate ligase [Fictibacillus sp. WQ 8-8]|uniref:ATP-grasp domain-containing protein n=1 Tax=unclassified Fictibacillus TaxID=2644029 RepID=UPI0021091EC8|nr:MULTISPECIES: RimK family alpha-L-glutamate ligase [unclassified Fictibacillus]MCQ6266456.1 RimK family alpha-L-glutamate ligase [Fictibacillus sp. WQ 8-8]MED2972945.1 RimK family alpha-L-glutamate ligase [Fictibacillus sp. B-59209]